jgi:hypothetical protein
VITETQLIPEAVANEMFERLRCVNDDYFMDRSLHMKNYGVDDQVGKYKSAFELPDSILEDFRDLAPLKVGEEELDMVLVNKYAKGDWLPKHKDVTIHTTMSLMFLGTGSYLRFYIDGKVVEVEEKPGKVVTSSTSIWHEVSEIDKERYVVLFMYR